MQTAPYSDVYFFIAIHMDEDSFRSYRIEDE